MRYIRVLHLDKHWRKRVANVTINYPDDSLVELWAIKADILDKLGRKDEAAKMRKRAAEPAKADIPSPYKSTHQRLKDWLKQHKMKTQKQ